MPAFFGKYTHSIVRALPKPIVHSVVMRLHLISKKHALAQANTYHVLFSSRARGAPANRAATTGGVLHLECTPLVVAHLLPARLRHALRKNKPFKKNLEFSGYPSVCVPSLS